MAHGRLVAGGPRIGRAECQWWAKPAAFQQAAASLCSPTMERVLSTFKRIKSYTDKNAPLFSRGQIGQGAAAATVMLATALFLLTPCT
jgi:hypothetical protein